MCPHHSHSHCYRYHLLSDKCISMYTVSNVIVLSMVIDLNIDWWKTNGCSERRPFCNIFETFEFVQKISTETHISHNLLNYIITRKDCNILSEFTVYDFISDHRVIYSLLQYIRPHPV